MKRWLFVLLLMLCVSAQGQIRIYSTYAENYAATQLQEFLEKGGCKTTFGGRNTGKTVYVGLPPFLKDKYKPLVDSLRDDGYFIVGNGKEVVLHGAGEKGTLYAVYAFLEMMGYRLYTPEAMEVPDVRNLKLPKCCIVSNPAFEWREVSYYYPNHSQLYADWHHLHTQADRNREFGMFVHTFAKLVPPSDFFDEHPEYFSLNNGHRSRDGQLCLSNPEVLEAVCNRLSLTMIAQPIDGAPYNFKYWSVSPNDNYNVCECENCKRLDSLYGGPSGTLIWFVNQVARRFPDKTIATLAYQYTRKAPTSNIRPDSNVLIMLCPIEAGREQPIATSPKEASFRKDMEDWSRLTDNLFIWDYVVQFRNFWDPFPNLHVLQPNLQYFRDHGTRMMFEQASGADNITSWMDIRCYMIAKLMWNPDIDIDSVMTDFYQGYYGNAGKYVKEIIDTMTAALIQSGQTLNIYGYPIDGTDGYLSVERFHQYDSLMKLAYAHSEYMDGCFQESNPKLCYFALALEFARNELAMSKDLLSYWGLDSIPANIQPLLERAEMFCSMAAPFKIPQMMEMGLPPDEVAGTWRMSLEKRYGENLVRHKKATLRHPATAPYNTAGLTDGEAGIMDYRHHWLGFWGDTLDAVIDFGEPKFFNEISISFFFYPLSWIFLPQRVVFYRSDDGEQWERWGTVRDENPEVLATPKIYTWTVARGCLPIVEEKCRYLRVVAEPLPEIPSWHRAAGQKAWIFTDEIIVK